MNVNLQVPQTGVKTNVEPRCYTTDDIATMLGISMKCVYSLLKHNAFKSIRLPGGIYRIPKTSFDAWLEKSKESSTD